MTTRRVLIVGALLATATVIGVLAAVAFIDDIGSAR